MNQTVLLLLSFSLAGTAFAQPSDAEWLRLDAAFAQSALSGTPTLVYVQAAWCGPCRQMEQETFADPNIAARLNGFALARLTLDAYDDYVTVGGYRLSEADWAARLGADATPTLILLAPDGSILGRHTGFLPPDGLAPILDAVAISLL